MVLGYGADDRDIVFGLAAEEACSSKASSSSSSTLPLTIKKRNSLSTVWSKPASVSFRPSAYFGVDPGAHRVSRLPVRQPFHELCNTVTSTG